MGFADRWCVLDNDLAGQFVKHGSVVGFAEERHEVSGDRRADAIDADQFRMRVAGFISGGVHLVAQARERAVVPGQQPCRRLADLTNAERIDKTLEHDGAALVDGSHQLLHRLFAPTVALFDFVGVLFQTEKIGGAPDHPLRPELFNVLCAKPFNVEGVARHEMLEPFNRLRLTDQPARAAAHRLTGLAHRGRSAFGADFGKDIGFCARRAALQQHLNHLRDHVARALHDDAVANADIKRRDDIFVVQRGALNDHAAHAHRLQVSAPVRPTLMPIASTVVSACSAGNLCAIAQRGARLTWPNRSCSARRFTL